MEHYNSGGQNQDQQLSYQIQGPPSPPEDQYESELTSVRKTSCDTCTAIKVKCSGETPCKRCEKKGIQCVYSFSRKRGPPKGKKRAGATAKRSRMPVMPREEDRIEGLINFPEFGPTEFSKSPTLNDLRQMAQDFTEDRNWQQFHTPRNLLFALTAEVGALAELLMWKEQVAPGLTGLAQKEKQRVSEEIADIQIYLIRLADRCGVDLPAVTGERIQRNNQRYPKDKVKAAQNLMEEERQRKQNNDINVNMLNAGSSSSSTSGTGSMVNMIGSGSNNNNNPGNQMRFLAQNQAMGGVVHAQHPGIPGIVGIPPGMMMNSGDNEQQ